MARMSEAEKQKSHARILDAAAGLFRARGIDATSVSDVMQAAGLTHGGFYRHFASKAELVEAAFAKAVQEVVSDLESAEDEEARLSARLAYIRRYLSLQHAKNPGSGCPFASMGAELARTEGIGKVTTHEAIETTATLLGGAGNSAPHQGRAMLAMLVGTITLARLAETDEEAQHLIEAGQEGLERLQAKPF